MTITTTAARLGLVAALAAGLTAALVPSAAADQAPTPTDVVGVGSDIVQNSLDFLADGDVFGHPGYNAVGNKNRLISFDATADANGRNAFTDPALGASVKLNPSIVLRAGTSPVQRPNGGGAGLTALINDGKNGASSNLISFVRSPNLPTAAQQQTAQNNLGSPLHTIEFAEDKQVIATAATTNAPDTLSATDLVNIYNGTYKKWSDVPNYSGPAGADAIIPLIPQNGAGVQTVFLNALKAANGGTAVTLTGTVRQVQQNDPTTITGLSDAERPDAIVPFPVGRYTLLTKGYFKDPNTPYSQSSPAATLSASGIKLETGQGAFAATLPYYAIFRESDFADTTPWQPGSTLNWVQELFLNPGGATPYVESAPAQAILTAMGVTPKYVDLGNQTSG